MTLILVVGIILFGGFIFGELAQWAKLPRVTGYILAGIFFNPHLCSFVPADFPNNTDLITNIALAFIAFSIGGTLQYSRIKKLGKIILSITFWEAQGAFLAVAGVFIAAAPFLIIIPGASFADVFVPLGLLAASLAAPTDPSATLAVVHEYKAKGEVTSTIMGVAAFDDILGIFNYSFAAVVSVVLIRRSALTVGALLIKPALLVLGSIALGLVFGCLLNVITKLIARETEGMLIVVIFGLISVCYGLSELCHGEGLLASVAMGVSVANFNPKHTKIFNMLQRYTEELVFVLFFTISGMHLNFSVMAENYILIILFVLARSIGKYFGVAVGSFLVQAPSKIKRYVTGGLIPQGGIVVGLALLITQNDVYASFSNILLNIVIGATVVHEMVGPILAKASLARAGEI